MVNTLNQNDFFSSYQYYGIIISLRKCALGLQLVFQVSEWPMGLLFLF